MNTNNTNARRISYVGDVCSWNQIVVHMAKAEGTQFSYRGPRQCNSTVDVNTDRRSGSVRKVAVGIVTLNIIESIATVKVKVF